MEENNKSKDNLKSKLLARLGVFFLQLMSAFEQYIVVLKFQEEDIPSGDEERISLRGQQEQSLLRTILLLNNVIVPLEAQAYLLGRNSNIINLFEEQKNQIEILRQKAMAQQQINLSLAQAQLAEIGGQLEKTKTSIGGLRKDSNNDSDTRFVNITA